MRVGVIFAGGQSQRMGGVDKAVIMLNGKRLIDHVYERVSAQADIVAISGVDDYGLGVAIIPDQPLTFGGPANGVFSVLDWLRARYPEAEGFVTAPVDGPFLPDGLFERLMGPGSAVAEDDAGVHPTVAYWACRSLEENRSNVEEVSSLSLKRLAELTAARRVTWRGDKSFINLNRPEDVSRWENDI